MPAARGRHLPLRCRRRPLKYGPCPLTGRPCPSRGPRYPLTGQARPLRYVPCPLTGRPCPSGGPRCPLTGRPRLLRFVHTVLLRGLRAAERRPIQGEGPARRQRFQGKLPPGWRSRGYVPHFEDSLLVQSLVIRLHDAVPVAVVPGWKNESWPGPKGSPPRTLRRSCSGSSSPDTRMPAMAPAGFGTHGPRRGSFASLRRSTVPADRLVCHAESCPCAGGDPGGVAPCQSRALVEVVHGAPGEPDPEKIRRFLAEGVVRPIHPGRPSLCERGRVHREQSGEGGAGGEGGGLALGQRLAAR